MGVGTRFSGEKCLVTYEPMLGGNKYYISLQRTNILKNIRGIRWYLVDSGRAAVIVACWFSLALIASVYMFVFADKLADILFGVFLPVGLLVFVGLIVTIVLSQNKKIS